MGLMPEPVRPSSSFDETRAYTDAYAEVLATLGSGDLAALSAGVRRELADDGVQFQSAEGADEFLVDLVPRIVSASEWELLARGLTQRLRALERFLDDVYGRQEIVAAGVVPVAAITSASYFEAALAGVEPVRWITIAGLDIVRGADGIMRVLEDNLRTPSGLAYALAARRVVETRVAVPSGHALRALTEVPALLLEAIRSSAPADSERSAVLLSDGPRNSAYYEHAVLAELIGVPMVEPEALEYRGGRLWLRGERGQTPVDVVYRRTDEDRVFTPEGALTGLGELLYEPWRNGRLGLVNAFGTGVADDKLLHAYVEDMVHFYLGEEPELRSVTTYDLSQSDVREMALERIAELVIKPRDGHGGHGVMIGPACTSRELERVRAEVSENAGAFVAQEVVALSHHPTVCAGELEPRHIDLRPFVLCLGDRIEVVPGGLTRVALDAGEMIVNSSRNGGAKDTWVLA
jgi:carboxylate-amine ligase